MDVFEIGTKTLVAVATSVGFEQSDIEGIDAGSKRSKVSLSKLPLPVLKAMLTSSGVPVSAKNAIRKRLGVQVGDDGLDEPLTGIKKLSNVASRFVDCSEPTIEFDIAGKTYPIFFTEFSVSNTIIGKVSYARFEIAMMEDGSETIYRFLATPEERLTAAGGTTVRKLLASKGLRPIGRDTLERWKSCRDRSVEFSTENTGKQFVCLGEALKRSSSWWEPTVALPRGYVGRVVVEPCMEAEPKAIDEHNENVGHKHLPFVRCFSLDTKEYVYVDIENLKPFEYDAGAEERLILPERMKSVLSSLFRNGGEECFGDVFNDRHGGIVVLAAGKPGVGKTLTAEVYAHVMRRPLYSIDLTELGTNVATVESSLNVIFQRVSKWNAVLLLDEADIFMAERKKEELERSAIVGVFLRVLDRYRGTLFLTTNRTEVLDPAFASRITIKLDYPDFDAERRLKVWKLILGKAGISAVGDIGELSELEMNGRQIRNCVRLVRIIHPTEMSLQTSAIVEIAKMNVR